MNGVLVGNEVIGFCHFRKGAGKELVIMQIVDDKVEAFKPSVRLGEEFGVVHQLRDGNVGEFGE